MELYEREPSMEEHRPDSSTGLEESIWQLKLDGDEDLSMYPERPGEPDCTYYIRTGSCGYGDSCRFNHPRDRRMVADTNGSDGIVKYSENAGQPICQFFWKTGTCKYGALCKYDHSRQGGGLVLPITLNIHGYPVRPGEKECSYYMRTGSCKFGTTCKYHHPQISGISMPSLAPIFYSTVQPPVVSTSHQFPITRPTILPAPYMQGPYDPMLFSSEIVPIPRWSSCQGDSVCAYYAQFGMCKYGSACKYDHPMGVLNYIPSMSALVNMPVVPRPVRFPIPTLAPSSSFSELPPEFTSNEYSVTIGMPSSGSMSSSSADPMVSEGGLVPQSVPQSTDQTCTPARSSTVGQSGDVSSSN